MTTHPHRSATEPSRLRCTITAMLVIEDRMLVVRFFQQSPVALCTRIETLLRSSASAWLAYSRAANVTRAAMLSLEIGFSLGSQ